MKKNELKNGRFRIIIFSYLIVLLSVTIFLIAIFSKNRTISYLLSLIFFVVLAILIFIQGIIVNKKDNYIKNINLYIGLYFILLFNLTFFLKRSTVDIFNLEKMQESINLIPFKTISSFINNDLNSLTLYNLLGNLTAFVPLSFLLLLKDEKYKKLKNQLTFLFVAIFIVEVLQLLLGVGVFDIDDIILNIGGCLLFVMITSKLITKIKFIFYSDFKMSKTIKYILLGIVLLAIILFDIFFLLILWH